MKKKILNNKPHAQLATGLLALITVIVMLPGCKKYLDAKPDQSIATPTTIDDLEGILNNYYFINANYPAAGEVASDNYFLSTTTYNSLVERQRMFYTWQKYDNIGGDYTGPYSAIEYANVMLDALPNIKGGDIQTRNMIEGNSLFIRGAYHFSLAQLFAKPYNRSTAASDPGVALRLTSDITIKPVRSSVADNYNAILADLKKSIGLLPDAPVLRYRASKPAAYGMLARVYLAMNDYDNAGLYADSALSLYSKLIDYNSVSSATNNPFPQFNDEVIYDANASQAPALSRSRARVDSNLYSSYDASDLRKMLYFQSTSGGYYFKGSYTGHANGSLFTGIATDELYLTKAEAQVRKGDISGGMATLNSLMSMRFQTGLFVPYSTSDPGQALAIVLAERRKELLFRGIRWMDLRRLNQDQAQAITLHRVVNDTTYQLLPGSPRYVFEIDQNAVNISGLAQNP